MIGSIVPDAPRGTMDPLDATRGGAAVFDLPRALENAMGDLELLSELAEIFCASSDASLKQIAAAAASRDGEALRRAAHNLKGSLSPFCAADAQAAARRMEDLGRDRDFAAAERALGGLGREVARLCDALGELLIRPGTSS